jgi:hypothetical protein
MKQQGEDHSPLSERSACLQRACSDGTESKHYISCEEKLVPKHELGSFGVWQGKCVERTLPTHQILMLSPLSWEEY